MGRPGEPESEREQAMSEARHDKPSDGAAGSDEPTVIEGELVDDSTALDVSPQATPVDYTDAGVPTLDYVRERIESRFASSTGATELAGESTDATSLDEQLADRDRAGRDKLEQIRRSMRGE